MLLLPDILTATGGMCIRRRKVTASVCLSCFEVALLLSCSFQNTMLQQIALLAVVTILGVLEQAYFAMQVIYVRRKCKVSPPATSGSPEFDRIFRAQANCSEYFPIFLSVLWVAGVFFHQALAAFCGFVYLYARFLYFTGYARSAQGRLGPMYFNTGVLCVLIGMSVVGLIVHFVPLAFHF